MSNSRDINKLFLNTKQRSKGGYVPPQIPPQLRMLLDENPDHKLRFAQDDNGVERKVAPKPKSLKESMRQMGLPTALRGRGFTRKDKEETKTRRKMAKASRRRNR